MTSLTELIEVPGGSFTMGGGGWFYADESPVHRLVRQRFAIERHPATKTQFASFVADTDYVTAW